MKQIGDL